MSTPSISFSWVITKPASKHNWCFLLIIASLLKPRWWKCVSSTLNYFKQEITVSCLALDTDFSFLAVELVPTFGVGVISLESTPGPASHSTGSLLCLFVCLFASMLLSCCVGFVVFDIDGVGFVAFVWGALFCLLLLLLLPGFRSL